MRPQSDAPSTDRPESTRTEALSANAPSGAPLPPQLLDQIFRQELLDQGPASQRPPQGHFLSSNRHKIFCFREHQRFETIAVLDETELIARRRQVAKGAIEIFQ